MFQSVASLVVSGLVILVAHEESDILIAWNGLRTLSCLCGNGKGFYSENDGRTVPGGANFRELTFAEAKKAAKLYLVDILAENAPPDYEAPPETLVETLLTELLTEDTIELTGEELEKTLA